MFSHKIMLQICEYISFNSHKKITIKELERISGYTKRHINRMFKLYIEVSPAIYIKNHRKWRIALEVKNSRDNTSLLFKKLGFKSNIAFIKYFKENFQQTPDEFKLLDEFNMLHFPIGMRSQEMPKIKISFVSIFNYSFKFIGLKKQFKQKIRDFPKSIFNIKSEFKKKVINKYDIKESEIWACTGFSQYNDDEILISYYVGPKNGYLDEGESIPLQGDYLRFEWTGVMQDTFPVVKYLYDIFSSYGCIRLKKMDIENHIPFTDMPGFYSFNYYIPLKITLESIEHISKLNHEII